MNCYAEGKTPQCPLGNDYMLDTENSDEFNDSQLDKTKWWDYSLQWRGRKEFLFSHNNVSVKNGFLELVAKTIPEEEMTYEDRCNGIMPYTMPTIKSRKKSLTVTLNAAAVVLLRKFAIHFGYMIP